MQLSNIYVEGRIYELFLGAVRVQKDFKGGLLDEHRERYPILP